MFSIVTLLLVGTIILIHEAGHFFAARCVSIPVRIFSIGFGPALFKYMKGSTEYRISLIPLGGYVLPDIEDEKEYFAIPISRRIVLSLGGPAANILTTFLCFSIMNSIGHGLSFHELLIRPFEQTAGTVTALLFSLAHIFSQPENLSGIIGIVSQGGTFISAGYINALKFTGFMSMNLAIINLLPIPSLDGGKVVLCLLEKIHPRLRKLHFPLAIAGWIVILGIMVYSTILDIGKLA